MSPSELDPLNFPHGSALPGEVGDFAKWYRDGALEIDDLARQVSP